MKLLYMPIVFLFFTLLNNSLHAEKILPSTVGEVSDHNQKEKSAQKEMYDAHRSYTRYHFEDDEMDFAFQWLLGSIPNGGAEIGEAFYVAGNIADGNPESWQKEWEDMAIRKEIRAKDALRKNNKITACENYLKASNYYRTALVSMLPDNPKFNSIAEKIQKLK